LSDSAAAACLFPGFHGDAAPDWLKGLLGHGLGGVVLFGRNIRDPEQVAALTASLRAERPELIVATDEEGGEVEARAMDLMGVSRGPKPRKNCLPEAAAGGIFRRREGARAG